jgi:putative oxidoreductase
MDLAKYADHAAFVGRLFYSSLYILDGYFKLTGFAGATAYMAKQGLPAPALFALLPLSLSSAAAY